MNKDEFNALEVLKQIDYINKQLENNKSITGICKTLGVGRSTIRDRFKKLNYTYDKVINEYIVIEIEEADSKLVTLRVNSKILDEFNKFCDNNKQFRKVDLLSQAIKNFIDQYS